MEVKLKFALQMLKALDGAKESFSTGEKIKLELLACEVARLNRIVM